jgi:hypothetical protein
MKASGWHVQAEAGKAGSNSKASDRPLGERMASLELEGVHDEHMTDADD